MSRGAAVRCAVGHGARASRRLEAHHIGVATTIASGRWIRIVDRCVSLDRDRDIVRQASHTAYDCHDYCHYDAQSNDSAVLSLGYQRSSLSILSSVGSQCSMVDQAPHARVQAEPQAQALGQGSAGREARDARQSRATGGSVLHVCLARGCAEHDRGEADAVALAVQAMLDPLQHHSRSCGRFDTVVSTQLGARVRAHLA